MKAVAGKGHDRWALTLMATLICAPLPIAAQRRDIVLATTTSVRDAGLLEHLLPRFERVTGLEVRVLAVGSGQAMALGRQGEADVLILHDPVGEKQFVEDGYGVEREALMHNQFVVVGPAADPAGVRRAATAVAGLETIAASGAVFVSRGDRSGTHVKETMLWGRVGRPPDPSWYRESGQGMSATLQIAAELRAYTITDVGTFLAHKAPLDLQILVQDDAILLNPYHVVIANPDRFDWVNAAGGRSLSAFLRSPETQALIAEFGREAYGTSLFLPDAVPTR